MSDLGLHGEQPREDVSSRALSSAFARQIEVIVSTAEQAAGTLAQEMESAAKQRAASIAADAQRSAEQIVEEARKRAGDYLTASRRRIDEYAAERIKRLSELTDGLIEVGEAIAQRHAHAEEVNRRLYELISAVGDAAETVTREAAQPSPDLTSESLAPMPANAPLGSASAEHDVSALESDGEPFGARHGQEPAA